MRFNNFLTIFLCFAFVSAVAYSQGAQITRAINFKLVPQNAGEFVADASGMETTGSSENAQAELDAIQAPTVGMIPMKNAAGFTDSSIEETTDMITVGKDMTVQDVTASRDSVCLGEDVCVGNHGGRLSVENQISGVTALPVGRAFSTAGTAETLNVPRLTAQQSGVFQPLFAETRTISGTQSIDYVFDQQVTAFNQWNIVRCTGGLLTFDIFVARDATQDSTLTDAQLIALPREDKIQIHNGLVDYERREGTGNPDYFDCSNRNGEGGNAANDRMYYKTDVEFGVGRKLIISGYSPDESTVTIFGGVPPGDVEFAAYLETAFQSLSLDTILVNDDASAAGNRTLSAAEVDSRIAAGVGSPTAANVSVSDDNLTGVVTGSGNVQVALDRLDNTGIGAAPRTFTGSFFPSYGALGNQGTWYGGRQTVHLVGARGQANGNYTFELPDPTELGLMFDDMVTRGIGEVYTLTVEYQGGSSSSIVRNSMTIRAPSVSVGFNRNEIPVTIAQGSAVSFRIERIGGIIQSWERLGITQSSDPVATLGEVVLQTTGWNNADNSFLPQGGMVLKGYAFPVIGSNPNDGTLRQGFLDSGVSDRVIYDGDYVVWTAESFTAWTNGDDWFVLNRDSLQRLSREQSNFLSQTGEFDNTVEVAPVNALGSEGVVWISENPLATAPFLTPSTDPSNPRVGDDYRYIGGRENRDGSGLNFQFSQNRFNSYLTVGVTPSFITAHGADNIRVRIRDQETRTILDDFSLADDFTFRDDSDFTNATYRHYTRSSTVNYPFLATIEVVLTQVQEHFRLNPNTVDVTQNVSNIQELQLSSDIQDKLNRALPPPNTDFSSIEERISPYKNVTISTPASDALFLSGSPGGAFPSDLSSFSQVSADNPRFTTSNTVLFVAVPEPGAFTLRNNNTDAIVALDNSEADVSVIESITRDGTTFFVYHVVNIISGNRYEVERTQTSQVVAWPDDINNLQGDISRIDAELKHALINLDDAVVQVFENEVGVTEQTDATVVATDYNKTLAGSSNTTQTVFYEPTPNAISGGLLNSKPFSDLIGDQVDRKLVYLPTGTTYTNQAYLIAFDGTTGRDLIRYENGVFNARVRVPASPAGSSTETIYPAPPTQVSGNGIWITVPALTFQNGRPVPEADEVFFTRNIPTSPTTLNIQYRGHANGNVFGSSSTTLAGVGGSSDALTTFLLDDGGEQAIVEVLYRASQRDIRVSVTETVRTGLPTINDIQVILSWDETRIIPATNASTRNVPIENEHSGGQVFAIKPSASDTLILVGDRTEIDTGFAYTTLFGAGRTGHLILVTDSGAFFNYEDFDPISTTVASLQNHETLPQFGLFTTEYTEETTLDIDVSLEVPTLNISNIPTTATGLSSGDIWNNGGVLNIVP